MLPPDLPAWFEERYRPREVLVFDLESRSEANLPAIGAGAYWSHPSTQATLSCWKFLGDDEVQADVDPQMGRLREAVKRARVLVAHNATFDLIALGFPWRAWEGAAACTMAMCASLNYPRSLEAAARAINEFNFKLEQPDEIKGENPNRNLEIFAEAPEDAKRRLLDYAKGDVAATEELFLRVLESVQEAEFDAIDAHLRVNCRGLPLDRRRLAAERAERERKHDELAMRFQAEAGFGYHHVGDLLGRINGDAPGALFEDQRPKRDFKPVKSASEFDLRLVYPKLEPPLQKLIDLRLAAIETGAKRLATMEDRMDLGAEPIGRLRDCFRFAEAATGRWSSKGMNMQNCKRGGIEKDLVIAPPGHLLYVGDFSQIEARMALWIARDLANVRRMHEEDDFYKIVAARLFNVAVEAVGKQQRRIGKALVLGCNYQMGPPKFKEYCFKQGLELTQDESERFVDGYRRAIYCLPRAWKGLMRAAIGVMRRPELGWLDPEGTQGIRMRFDKLAKELVVRLPSGRLLRYGDAELEEGKDHRAVISYYDFGRDQEDGRGGGGRRFLAHGGLILENLCQAASRDLLCRALVRFERGLRDGGELEGVVGHVHDELIAVVEKGRAKEQLDGWLVEEAFRKEGKAGLLLDLESDMARTWGQAK